MKYYYEYHDGDDWMAVDELQFSTPEEAKRSGVEAGYEYVRVKSHPSPAAGDRP